MTVSVVINEEIKEVLLEESKNQIKQMMEDYRSTLDFQYVKKKKLAKLLGVSEQTISKWMQVGMPYLQIERVILYDLTKVKKWVETFKKGEEL